MAGEIKTTLRPVRGVFRLLSLFLKLIFLKILGRLDASTTGRLIGDFCQRMGGLWVKVGQLLSMRSDLFPPELCAELARLQYRVEGFSPQLAKEKTWVAIKVRRPGIDRVFAQDLALIRRLFLLFHRFSIMMFMRWPDMLWEMEQVFNEELDYRYEISNQQRLRQSLENHRIYVPKVFQRYCMRQP